MEGILSKAQKCLIKCLRISGMTIGQIAEIMQLVWDREIEMLEYLTQNPTMDHKKLYTIACEISEKYKSEMMEDYETMEEDETE